MPARLMWLPFAVFAVFFLLAAVRAFRFFRGVRAVISDGSLGKSVHLETPAGTVDATPRGGRDPALAALPLYPGALVVDPQSPEYSVDWNLLGRHVQYASETYWTPDPGDRVCEFFERSLPGWSWDRHFQHGSRLCREDSEVGSAITIRRQGDRTMIETAVTRKAGSANPAAGVISTDSSFGTRQ